MTWASNDYVGAGLGLYDKDFHQLEIGVNQISTIGNLTGSCLAAGCSARYRGWVHRPCPRRFGQASGAQRLRPSAGGATVRAD